MEPGVNPKPWLQEWFDLMVMCCVEADECTGTIAGDAYRMAMESLTRLMSECGIELDTRGEDFEPRNRWHWKPAHELPETSHGFCMCGDTCETE